MLIVRSSSGYSSTTTVSPSCTVCPSRTRISFTAPARGASTGISIFILSSTITGSPAATLSPTLAVTWKTTPVMCALISSAMERSLFDHLSVHPTATEFRMGRDRAQQRQRRLHPLHHARIERPRQPLQRLPAVAAVRDELEQQRGIHVEEREAALVVHQELERAGVDVADRARAGERGLGEPALGPRIEIRRRRLLDELLMAALDRALALVQMHDRAFAVAEDLHLDVAGRFEIALHVHLA